MEDLELLKQEINKLTKLDKSWILEEFCRAAFIAGQESKKRREISSKETVPRSLISVKEFLREQVLKAKVSQKPVQRLGLIAQPTPGFRPELLKDKKKLPTPPLPTKVKPEFGKIKPFVSAKKEEILEKKSYPLIQVGDKVLVSAEINDFYKVIEPGLEQAEKKVIDELIEYKPAKLSKRKFLEKKIKKLCKKNKISYTQDIFDKIRYFIDKKLFGWGRLESLFRDGKISSISCVGNEVSVVYDGVEKKTNITFDGNELDKFIEALANRCNVDLNKEPFFDKTLPDGIRLHVTYGGKIIASRFVISKPNIKA